MKKIKNMLLKISNLLFYGRYKKEMKDINKNSNFKEYVIKIILSLIVFFIVYFLLFEKIFISVGLTIVTSMFYINQIYLNNLKFEYIQVFYQGLSLIFFQYRIYWAQY